MKARIQFDGGCKPNPGNKYGSYEVLLDDVFNLSRNRFPLGWGTNNEAEFESLLMALKDLHEACEKSQVNPVVIEVEIYTDSTIVKNWLLNFNQTDPRKVKNARRLAMYGLAEKCISQLKGFHSFTIQWNPRAKNVETFGH